MASLGNVQREVGEWSEENFGDQPVVNPLLGVGEEFGELVEYLKSHESVQEHELDCVGDLLVYLADFCHRRGLDCEGTDSSENLDGAAFDDPLDGVAVAIGRLDRSVLKRRQGIRLDEDRVGDQTEQQAISMLVDHLAEFAQSRGYTLEDCIRVAWYEEVVHREWDSRYTDS